MMRDWAIKRAVAFGLALALSTQVVNAKEIILKCRTVNSDGVQQLTIDLENRWLAFGKKDDGTAGSWFDILKVSEKAITAILTSPIITHGEEIVVLNRETGQYIMTNVSLSCTDTKCLSQTGPTLNTFRGNCRPPAL
jgi:hypothetical protein